MKRISATLLLVLWWGLLLLGCNDDGRAPPPPPPECELVPADCSPGGLDVARCECTEPPPPPLECGEFAHAEELVCVCDSEQLFMNEDGDCECRSFRLTLDDAIPSVWNGTDCAPPDPPPPPASKPAHYIQWTCHLSKPQCQDRFEWAETLDHAYTVWRGERDLSALLDEGSRYLKGGDRELVDLTPAELGIVIAQMASVNARGDRLIHRIVTERHRSFQVDPVAPWHRSQVRKDVARAMRDELEDETEIYTNIARQVPEVPECDSLRCRVRKMNELEP